MIELRVPIDQSMRFEADGTIAIFLDAAFQPTTEEDSKWVKVIKSDGEVIFGVRKSIPKVKMLVEKAEGWDESKHPRGAVTKYREDQARVPAGSPEGGEFAGAGSTTAEMPSKKWRDPPPPKGTNKRPPGGYSANGLTNTIMGDLAEATLKQLDLQNMHPDKRQGTLDVRFDHTDRAFEVKTCAVESSEYKIKFREWERKEKIEYAEQNHLQKGMMIAVMELDKAALHVYWRDGIGAYRLTGPKDWHYAGTFRMPGAMPKPEKLKKGEL